MFLVSELLLALVVYVLVAQFLKQRWMIRRLPPGPTPLPIIGNLWSLNFEVHYETLIQLAKTHGNVFTIWLGLTPVIVLNGCQTVRNALISHSEELSGRPSTPLSMVFMGDNGIVFSNGQTWKQQRRFGMMAMRNLGLGKKSLEVKIKEVSQQLLELFRSENGKAMDPAQPIASCVANVISSVVFGHCFSSNDKSFQQMLNAINSVINTRTQWWSRVYDAFPSIMSRLPLPQYEVFVEWEKARSYVKQEIRTHQENLSDEPQDFIDFYLRQMEQTTGDPSSPYEEANLVQVVLDLFFAGTETTTTTLRWALLYMTNHPEIQDKVQKELDSVLGDSQAIFYEDRKKLPYTNAVIHEIQRYSNIVGLGVPRECVQETTLQGYQIKKGTAVFPNLSSVLFDPGHWETPRQFNPEHFLDKEGNFVNREAFLPFGAGHRVCFGEQMARVEFFIFFSSLLRSFTFQPPEGIKKLKEDFIHAGTMLPHPYKVCAIPR
ncbi:hypothetical protein NDU88_000569 [Pleurodeles waltl]|uniref:Uncharacterized protein n=1 Tax=Pleurodeles waltl TaxID=8319 RepID=A0AAV7L6X0_PLEWA|nr:hypothetical protein NDU88_000569 [Pleurodeles waltl]